MRKLAIALAAVALVVPVAVAGAAVPVTVVVHYNLAAGEQPENLAVDKRGDVFVAMSPLGQVRKVDRDLNETTVAQLVPPGSGFGPLGIAIDAPGNLYVDVATFNPATAGVYRIATDGSFVRLAGTGGMVLPNGIALDQRGNIYVTDSVLGAVWRLPAHGGAAAIWLQSPLLAGNGSAGIGVPIGANGIAFRQNSLIVANSEGARLVKIPIKPDGSPGTATVLAEGSALYGIDGIALDVHGNVWAAVILQSAIKRVSTSGQITTIATAADGLDFTSGVAFGKNQDLWAVNFAIGPPGGTGPALLRLDAGVKGQPLP
jgi:sugar lactone lactonase YvrE